MSLERSATQRSLKIALADFLGRRALGIPALERTLAAGCRRPSLRRALRLGAIAQAYARVLDRPEIRTAELPGYGLRVNVSEHTGIASFFFNEPGVAWIAERLALPGSTCVDAGANMGHYTLFLANRVGPGGRVFSFEPSPRYADLISQSVALNAFEGRVVVDRRALFHSSAQKMTFYLSTESSNSGTSSLVNHGSTSTRSTRSPSRPLPSPTSRASGPSSASTS
jgi:FkbM family methyltransferase